MGKNDQYYAVARGRQVGIYRKWNECKKQIDGFQNARFKKFDTEAEARKFVADNMSVGGEKPFSNSTPVTPVASPYPVNNSRKRKFVGPSQPTRTAKVSKQESEIEDPAFVGAPIVYTDGACSSNGRKHAKAGWGVFWGDGSDDNEFGPVYGAATNNRGEYIAVEKAIEKAIEKGHTKLIIKTDSNLLVQSMNTWIHGWKRKGWKTATGSDVLNKDVLLKLDSLRQKVKVKFVHVRGHAGIDGNEKADELARKGAQMYTAS